MAKRTTSEVVAADAARALPLAVVDLAPDIARQLEEVGEFRVTFVPSDPQRLVDLRWAALGAGRLIGRKVRVAVTRAGIEPGSSPVTVRMTSGPESRTTIPRQRHHGD